MRDRHPVRPPRPPPSLSLILASASPRRLTLLARVGVTPVAVVTPSIDEKLLAGERPDALAQRLATAKAEAVPVAGDAHCVLAADTVVGLDGASLGKASAPEQARATLRRLSGRTHWVFTAVAVKGRSGRVRMRTGTTAVTFRALSTADVDAFIASGDWRDKAGCYGIQGRAAGFCARIDGSFSNVIGLPLGETVALLGEL